MQDFKRKTGVRGSRSLMILPKMQWVSHPNPVIYCIVFQGVFSKVQIFCLICAFSPRTEVGSKNTVLSYFREFDHSFREKIRKLCKTQNILLLCAGFQVQNKCPQITKPDNFVKDAVSIPSGSCDLLYRFSMGFLQNTNILFDLCILPSNRSRFQKYCFIIF